MAQGGRASGQAAGAAGARASRMAGPSSAQISREIDGHIYLGLAIYDSHGSGFAGSAEGEWMLAADNGYGKSWAALNPAERAWIQRHPSVAYDFFQDARKAMSMADTLFPGATGNGSGDAFRHGYWSALMTRGHGEMLAHEFANLHEMTPNNSILGLTMDLHNNAVGRSIALTQEGPGQTLPYRIMDAISNGRMWWISGGHIVNGQ